MVENRRFRQYVGFGGITVPSQNDDNLDFEGLDDLLSPGEELTPMEISDDLSAEGPLNAMEEPAVQEEPAMVEPEARSEAEPAAAQEPSSGGSMPLAAYADWLATVGVAVAALALGLLGFIYLGTAVYVMAVAIVGTLLWKDRKTNSIYTVLLGCALIAIVTAVYCLWIELERYHFEIRAKRRASVSATIVPAIENVG